MTEIYLICFMTCILVNLLTIAATAAYYYRYWYKRLRDYYQTEVRNAEHWKSSYQNLYNNHKLILVDKVSTAILGERQACVDICTCQIMEDGEYGGVAVMTAEAIRDRILQRSAEAKAE
jgi:hypothetical protein